MLKFLLFYIAHEQNFRGFCDYLAQHVKLYGESWYDLFIIPVNKNLNTEALIDINKKYYSCNTS